jgi:U3 small nucleolar RNA-associated protein 15
VCFYFKLQDYIRAGCVSPISSDILVSGSYDHSVNVWDKRSSSPAIHTFVHGSPVEAVLMLPNGTLLVTAGGSEVKIWDLLAGNRLLTTINAHNKTVTSLGLATNNTRLVTASLDRQLKLHDLSTWQVVHSLTFPSAILSAGISPDNSFISAGMADGLVQFMHRKVPPTLAEREAERMKRKSSHKYLQYTNFETAPDDLVVKEDVKAKESR